MNKTSELPSLTKLFNLFLNRSTKTIIKVNHVWLQANKGDKRLESNCWYIKQKCDVIYYTKRTYIRGPVETNTYNWELKHMKWWNPHGLRPDTWRNKKSFCWKNTWYTYEFGYDVTVNWYTNSNVCLIEQYSVRYITKQTHCACKRSAMY